MLDMAISAIREEAIDIRGLHLTPIAALSLPSFQPGAHVVLHLPGNLLRAYSLLSDLGGQGYEIAVKREANSRGGSHYLHESAQIGQRLTVSAPQNFFPIRPGRNHRVLLAAGIGITPLLPMAQHFETEGCSFQLDYVVRSPAHALLREPMLGRRRLHAGFTRTQLPGLITRIVAEAPPCSDFYICGPEGFMDLTEDVVQWSGRAARIFRERFAEAQASGAADKPFHAILLRSGLSVEVKADQTLLQALAAIGRAPTAVCRQGQCGSCLLSVKAGTIDHRDAFLTEAEREAGDLICCCISRCKGDELVLDL